jgi:hypothetical protein
VAVKARGEIPIIIFCAEDDEAVLAKVVDELRREGLAPELVPGVEFDGNLLTAAVDGAAGETLFVLCGSATIDKAAVRRLTGLFSARCGPGHRIISTQLTPSRPLAVMPAIRGAIKEMRLAGEASESDEPVPESTTSHLRDVVEAFADPPPRRVPARPPAERPATREPSRPVQSAAPAVRETPPQTAPAATPRRSAPASSDASPQAVVNDDVVRSIEQRLAAVPAMPDSLVSTDPSASGLHARRAPPAGESSGRRPVYDEPRGNRMLLVFAGVGIAGILALALMQLLQPSPSPATGTRAPAKANAPEKAEPPTKAPETKVATPPPETKVEPPPETKVEPPPDAKVEPPPDAKVEPPPDAKVEPPPPPDVPPAPVAVSRRDRDLAALELGRSEGKVDKLGSLWVVKGSDDDGTWEDAQRKCGGRRVNGVHGFRLPGLRELKKIRAAGVIASGNYWTRDKREADEAIAYDAGSGTTNVYLTIEPNARAICVRVL